MKKGEKALPNGIIRILSKGLVPVKKTNDSWTKTKDFDNANIKKIVELFKAHDSFNVLIDSKDKKFLKGYLTKDKRVGGERISVLPNRKKLDKAYSLFSPHLTIHDEEKSTHWDVIFQNPNKNFSYLYTIDKKDVSLKKKYERVKEFKKKLPELQKNLEIALKKGELMALALYTLIKTHIRVGNETYYKINGHKGLTTLKKEDISINKDKVRFNFIGKDGVPQDTVEEFPKVYIIQLTNKMKPLKKEYFVFTDNNGKPLKDTQFEEAFLKYCGKKFYPHIVRSYYATTTVEEFLDKNKAPSKKEVIELYDRIAEKLGHKKFSKKTGEWTPSHSVTVAHYISPELVNKINKIVLKK